MRRQTDAGGGGNPRRTMRACTGACGALATLVFCLTVASSMAEQTTPSPAPPSPSSSVVSTYVALTLQGITAQQLNDTASLLAYRKILAKYLIGTSYLGIKPAYERVNITMISSGPSQHRKILSRNLQASSTTVASSVSMLSTTVQSGSASLQDAYNGGGLLSDLNSGGISTSSLCCLQVDDAVFPLPASATSPPPSGGPPSSSPADSGDGGSAKGLGVVAIGVICGVVAVVAVVALFGARAIVRNRSKEREGSKEQIVTDVVARAAKRHNWTHARVAMMQRLLGMKISGKPPSPEQSTDKDHCRGDDVGVGKDSADQLGRVTGSGRTGSPVVLPQLSEAGKKLDQSRNTSGTSESRSGDGFMPRARVVPLTPDGNAVLVAAQDGKWVIDSDAPRAGRGESSQRLVLEQASSLPREPPPRFPDIHRGAAEPLVNRRLRGESDAGGAVSTPAAYHAMPKRSSTGCLVPPPSLPAGEPASPMGWPVDLHGLKPPRDKAFEEPGAGGNAVLTKRGVSMSVPDILPEGPRLPPGTRSQSSGLVLANRGQPRALEHQDESDLSDLEMVNNFLRAAGSGTSAPFMLDQPGVAGTRNPVYDTDRASGLEPPPRPSTLRQPGGAELQPQAREAERVTWEEQQREQPQGPPERAFDLKSLAAQLKSQRLRAGNSVNLAPSSSSHTTPKTSKHFKAVPDASSRGTQQDPASNPTDRPSRGADKAFNVGP